MRTDAEMERISASERLMRLMPEMRRVQPPPRPPRCWIDGQEYELNEEGEWEAVDD